MAKAMHITVKQFDELCSKSIILPSGAQSKDKYGNIYTCFHLNKENL